MLPINNNGPWTYTTGEALACDKGACLLVTLDTAGKIVKCGASGFPIGVVRESFASGVDASVWPLRGEVALQISAAIAKGDFVKPAAAGQIAPEATVTTLTAASVGQAMTAGTTAADVVWINAG